MPVAALLIVAGYLLGSLSTAIITCRAMGLADPREDGSGNPGATNVLRLGGKKAAIITLAGDLLKGLVPVLIARLLDTEPAVVALVGIAAFLGHLYPVFFRFQGGKGVATAFGVILGISPLVAGCVLGTWLAVAAVTRLSSLAALLASALAPGFFWILGAPTAHTVGVSVMAVLLIWRHRSNIQRLLEGSESRIGGGKAG